MARIVEVDIGNGKTATITEPDRDDFDDNLGGAVQYALANVITWLAKTSGEAIGSFGGAALVSFLEHIEPGLVEIYQPLIDEILENEDLPPVLRSFLETLKEPTSEAGAAAIQAIVGSAAGGVTSSLLGVLTADAIYWLNQKRTPARPVLPDAWAMLWRGRLADDIYKGYMKDLGWSDTLIEEYEAVLKPRVTIADLLTWMYRVGEDEETVKLELAARGYDEDEQDKLIELSKRLPGPGDLVTFALREVWRPEIRPELLEPDAPELYYDLMAKQGFSRERAEDYWASHWRLPSASQGFEMFWRLDDFTEDDLKQLLIRLDILKAYQDKLIAIAYRPITRVDVRRMHATGQISDADLPRHYRDIGFSPEYAQMMADFTIAYNAGPEAEYTKTEILKGFRLGMLTAEEAKTLLEDIGKSGGYAEFLLTVEVYKRELELLEQEIDIIKDRYVRWEIDKTTANARLMGLNLKAEHVVRLLEEWGIARRAKITLLTRAQIEEFYKDGVITEEQARAELTKRRYQEYAIDWLILDWDQQIADAARKEQERAEKEQQREAKNEFRNLRSMALANLNREIAELNLLIAETKLAIYDMERRDEYAVIKKQIADLWEARWVAKTDEERDAIDAAIDRLLEERGLLDTDIEKAERSILVAKRDIKLKQRAKAALPVALEEGG